ncbi:MAG: phospholipase [Fimbriimonadales bacterium]|nr:MAG: phospholipase [Fimbriimonadales bacterium]
MNALNQAVRDFVARVPTEQVEAVAERLRGASGIREPWAIESVVSTPAARSRLKALLDTWQTSDVSGDYLAGLLVGAAHAWREARTQVSVELVWTGPTTPFVATRRTEQVLLDLIRSAEEELFLVSFVAYDVPAIVEALNQALERSVIVRFLLESTTSEGGSLGVDPIANMRAAVPGAEFYAWRAKDEAYEGGRVHAKVAVADRRLAFISSANLTGHALGKNMEAGVSIIGGDVPQSLHDHLRALIETKVITRV